MNTAQAYGQHIRPVQKTGIEKVKSLLSIQQTFIDQSMDLMIDSSRFVVDNGNFPIGSTEDMFTRLTQRLIYGFLEGYATMNELPCLGDLADGTDEFHRITPSPTFSKSSQFKLLDSTGNLQLSSIVFMDLDFNTRIKNYLCESVLLDSSDASSTTFISSLEQFRSNLISQSSGHTIEESHQCSPIDPLVILKTFSGLTAESLCDSGFSETQVFMKSDGFSNEIDLMSAPIPISSDKENSETPVSMMYYSKDGSNIFDLVKGVRSEVHNSSVNASIIHSTSNGDSISSIDCIHLGHPCIDKFGGSHNLATISTDETSPKFSIPDPEHLNDFLYGNHEFSMFLASELQDEKLVTFDYPSLLGDSSSVDDEDVAGLSDKKFNDQCKDCVCNYEKETSDTSGVLIGLENGSSSGEYEEMEISGPCYTEQLDTHWPTVVDSSSFDVSDHEELLESYGLNNKDHYTDVGYSCASPTWPGKTGTAREETIQMNLNELASNKESLSSFYDENMKNSVSSTHLNQRECALNTSSHDDSSEDYLFQGHLSDDELNNSIEEPILGTTEKSLVYSIPNSDILEDFLFGNLNSPTFLAAELQDKKVDIIDGSFGVCYSDHCADEASLSDNMLFDRCNQSIDNNNVELYSDCSSKDPSAFPFDFSDHYELLESYGINDQEQYTNDFICKSPTWPGKV